MSKTLFALSVLGVSAAVAALVTPIVSWVAHSLGLLDAPGVRKVHAQPTPRIGGVGIAIATLAPLGILLFVIQPDVLTHAPSHVRGQLATLIGGAVTLLAVGLIDDVWTISAKWKLLALVLASLALCASGAVCRDVVLGSHEVFRLGPAAWPLTILWLVGVTVSVNFIDGLDGLAAGVVAAAAGVLAVGAYMGLAPIAFLVALCLAGALAGFLVHNHHPARTFMGDCGSMFIGYLLAGTCVLAATTIGSTTKGILLPALALVVPLFDTFFTMVRRGVLQRRSLFAAEGGHIHHRLLDADLRHGQVVMLLHGVTLVASGVAIVCLLGAPWAAALSAIVLCAALVGLFKTAGTVRARETLGAIRRNRAISRETRRYQSAFYDLQLHFRKARTVDDWWQHLCRAADVLDFGKLNLSLGRRDGTTQVMRWRRPRSADEVMSAADSITADVPVPQRRVGTVVRAEVEVLASMFLETGGLRVALFSRLMAECGLDRLPALPRVSDAAPAVLVPSVDPTQPAVATDGPFAGLKIAVVHDFLYTYGGAERVVEQLLAVFPHADIFALFDFLPPESRGFLGGRPVTPSFLQRMPGARRKHRLFLPLMPLAVEQLDVSAYDVIVSSSYVAAKGVITRPDQLHVCYCHTPVRFAWDLQGQYLRQTGLAGGLLSLPAKLLLHYIRGWDVRSAHGVDVFLTNSDFVGRRIAKTYRRPATTVYPPVDTTAFTLNEGPHEDFYLTASRLVPYKRVDLIIAAFNRMPERRLLVVGEGPELNELRELAGPNVTVLGHESAERLRKHMRLARAFVFAAEEDFGIVPVEAQACGTPVIAYGRGGATETVRPDVTGVLFDEQTPESLIAAVERFERMEFDPRVIRANAELFAPDVFRKQISTQVSMHWTAFKARRLNPGPVPLGGHRGEADLEPAPGAKLAAVPVAEGV
jgi:UDP-N-acetylmuramyl pentapeptide phosphotransferase/UDP-N-acetylglucosamine-1-phosphate transferase/glycosyltransferase involved in cell wall biosynthesis